MGQTRIDLLIDLEYQKALERLKNDLKGTGIIKINPSLNLSEVQNIRVRLEAMLGDLKDFKFNTDATGKVKSFFATYQNEVNQTVQAQYKLTEAVDEQGKSINSLDLVGVKYLDNIKKREQAELKAIRQKEEAIAKSYDAELKSNSEMEKAFLATTARRRKEREKADAAQLKAIEKNKEAELKALLKSQEFERQKLANLKLYAKEYEHIATLQSKGGFDFEKQSILQGGKLVGKGVISDTAEVTKFFQEIDDGTGKIRKYTMETDKASGSTRILSSGWREAQREHKTFNQELSIAIRRIVEWAIATQMVYGSLRKLREGYTFVYDLSNSLNEIRIVTGQSVEDVNRLAKSYNELAIAMGSTTSEITKSAVEYYRQGLSQEETNKRMEATIKYSKISGLAMQESTDIITAAANGTKKSVNEIIDVYANLGDATAAGADEIGMAMSKVAASAETAGVPFEQMSAYIATISSVTREGAETIGNSLKTLMARYTSIKQRGFNEEDATNLNEVTKALKTVGITAVDSAGQLRPFGEIMDEVGKKWLSLDGNSQKYLATTLAGQRQMNRLLTLFNNYPETLKNIEIAYDSVGVAQQKFDIYMESNEAKASIFKSTLDKLWMDTLNSESMGKLIEFGTETIKFIDKVGLLNIAIGALSVVFIILSNSIGKALGTLLSYIKTFGVLQTATLAFNPVVAGLALAIGGIVIAMNLASEANRKAKERTEEITSAYEDFNKALNAGKIDEVTTALKNLTEKVDYDNAIKKINQLKKEISELQNTVDNSPVWGSNFGNIGVEAKLAAKQAELNRLKGEVALVDRANSPYNDLLLEKKSKMKSASSTDVEVEKTLKSETTKDVIDEEKAYQSLYNTIRDLNYELSRQNEILSQKEDLDKIPILSDINDKLETQKSNLHAINEARREELAKLSPTSDRYQELIEKIQDTSLEWWKLDNQQKSNLKTIEKINEEQNKLSIDQLKKQQDLYKEQKKAIEEIVEVTKKMIKQQKEDQIKALKEEIDAYEEIIKAKKESLRLSEEQRDYEKDISEKQTDISKIQNRLLELGLDDSRESQAERLKLEEKLAELTSDLEERQHDRSIQLKEDALDEELKQFKDTKEDEIKVIQDYLDKSGKLTADAMALINSQSDEVYANLLKWNENYGTSIENDIETAWQKAKEALQSYKSELGTLDVESAINEIDEESIVTQMKMNSLAWISASESEKQRLHKENEELAKLIGAIYKKDGHWYKKGIKLYHEGIDSGFVGGLPVLKNNEEFAKLLKGELIINPIQMNKFMTNTLPQITGMNSGFKIDKLVDITVQGNLDSSVLPKIDDIVNKAVDKLVNATSLRGNSRNVKTFSI